MYDIEHRPGKHIIDCKAILPMLHNITPDIPLELKVLQLYKMRKYPNYRKDFKEYLKAVFKVDSDVELNKVLQNDTRADIVLTTIKEMLDRLIYRDVGATVNDAVFVRFVEYNAAISLKIEVEVS